MHCPGRRTFGLNFAVLDNSRYMIMSQKINIPIIHSFLALETLYSAVPGQL